MRPTGYRRNARGLRGRQAFEHVRMQAGTLFDAGHSQTQIARQLYGASSRLSPESRRCYAAEELNRRSS